MLNYSIATTSADAVCEDETLHAQRVIEVEPQWSSLAANIPKFY